MKDIIDLYIRIYGHKPDPDFLETKAYKKLLKEDYVGAIARQLARPKQMVINVLRANGLLVEKDDTRPAMTEPYFYRPPSIDQRITRLEWIIEEQAKKIKYLEDKIY